VRAMARDVVAEWRLAAACGDFRDLAGAGTRSDDRGWGPAKRNARGLLLISPSEDVLHERVRLNRAVNTW